MCGGYFNQEVAGILGNDALKRYYFDYISFPVALWDSFIGAFYRRPELNTPLWTIKYEFFCVIIVFALARIKSKKLRWILYILIMITTFILLRDIYIIAVLLGAVCFDILFVTKISFPWGKIKPILFGVAICLIALVIIGVYTVYFRLLLIIAICAIFKISKFAQKICENKFLLKLSKYTFAIYAIHWPILCSCTCYFYIRYTAPIMRLLNYGISLIIIIIVALLLEKINVTVTAREK